MVLYECEVCNFSSKIRTHFKRHLKTKKHMNNTKNLCSEVEKKYIFPPKPSKNLQNRILFPPIPSKTLRNRRAPMSAQIVTKNFQEKIIWSDI